MRATIKLKKTITDLDLIDENSIVPKWTPVSESLPAESGFYLVTDVYGEVVLASWFKYDSDDTEPQWWLAEYGSIEVVAWMPLPKPYGGLNNDKGH